MESLKAELKAVAHSKAMLEKELQEVISLTSTELEEYQEKVLELEDEVGRFNSVTFFNFYLFKLPEELNSLKCVCFENSFRSLGALRSESGGSRMPTRNWL